MPWSELLRQHREETCWQKRTKTPILCSKRPKMGVPKGKSAQKPRFCARKARKQGFRRVKAHKNLDFVLEMPENEGSRPQKRTKMPILCSGMVAASPAAPTGAQHYPPRALRGASGSSTPGNKLPQPTTQPVAKTYLPCIRPCIPPDNLPAAHTTVHTAVALPPGNLPPCLLPGHTTLLWVPRPAGG